MSWMSMLCQTYENNRQVAGKSNDDATLSVIAHMPANSQLEITINADGEFESASEVAKENRRILIPVTEASASRSSGIAPHALCDMLSYIAGDFVEHVSGKDKIKAEGKYSAYIQNLHNWAFSDFSHPKVMAIYKYLNKKTVMHDLFTHGIVHWDESGMLGNEKIGGQPYEKVLVRFIVLEGDAAKTKECWQDESLMDCYTEYYLSAQNGNKNICFITGKESVVTENHPKGIVSSNYGAKLISANDTVNYTFRGRFTNAQEACTVSYEASQKAHNALTWLAAKQGVLVGTQDKRTYICWNPSGKKVPFVDRLISFDDEEEDEEVSYTEEIYRKKLFKAVQGYKNQLDDNDDIVIIGLDAATTGRLSIVCYDELKASTFLENLRYWNETCSWYFTRFTQDHKPYQEVCTPLAKQIVRRAYGTEREITQGANQKSAVEVNDKLLKEQVQRIYNCIIDKRAIPKDMVRAIVSKASNPLAYKSRTNYENILSSACALIKKEKGGKVSMVLDEENTDRSYLFGRLLAVAEVAERNALGKEADRPTNATRLQSAFVNRPFSTWSNLKTALNPYMQRLSGASREFYENCIQDITCKFEDSDYNNMDRSLNPEYLLGYYLQRRKLYEKKGDAKDNNAEVIGTENNDTMNVSTIDMSTKDNNSMNREVQ